MIGLGSVLVLAASLIRADARRRRRAGLVAAVALLSVLLPLTLAAGPIDVFKDRNLIAAWPVLLVAIGVAAAAVHRRAVALAAVAAAAVAGVAVDLGVATEERLQRTDWRTAVRAIGPADRPRAIVVSPAYAYSPLVVYGRHVRPLRVGTGVRELVLLHAPPVAWPARLGPFVLRERVRANGFQMLRYVAPGLERIDRVVPGAYFEPGPAARAVLARLPGVLARLEGPRAGRAAAAAELRALLPLPPEWPDGAAATRALRERARAAVSGS